MRRSLLTFICLILVLSACSPAPQSHPSETPPPPAVTATAPLPTPTATTVPSATPQPAVSVIQAAELYSGPGNSGFSVLAELEAGAKVIPLGIYGDFIQVQSQADDQAGFIYKAALEKAPAGLPELSAAEVPWQKLDILDNFIDGRIAVKDDGIIVHNVEGGWMDRLGPGQIMDAPFRLTVMISTSDQQEGHLKFTDSPNTNNANWWEGIHRMDLGFDGRYLSLSIRDGISESSAVGIPLNAATVQPVTITFNDPYGKQIDVSDATGKVIKQVDISMLAGVQLPDGLFPDRMVYIGCVAAAQSKLSLAHLNLEKQPAGTWNSDQPDNQGLHVFGANRGITIGTVFDVYRLQDAVYRETALKDFDVAALGEFSWASLWLGRNEYDFEYLDNIVDWVIRNGWTVRASHLLWGATEESSSALPAWLQNSQFTRDEYIQIMTEHITTMVTRYKGKVKEWSIANEAASRSQWKGSDFWMDKIGPEYIEIAFRTARAADPDAVLIFNDSNNESSRDALTSYTVNKMYAIVKDLKDRGVPIDVVGMQMHLLLKYSSPIAPKKEDVIATMQKFAALGVKIYITEFDVDISQVPGTQEEKLTYEANLYRDMVSACIESGVCTSFSTWGISDSTSWITCTEPGCVNVPDAEPLMYDQDFNPKPAYYAVLDALK